MDLRFSWLFALLLGGTTLLSLSACDDSSTVGLGVGPDSLRGGEPKTVTFEAALDTTTVAPETGRQVSRFNTNVNRNSWRFLVGQVDDPLAGTIRANGYFDVLGRSALPEELLEADPDSLAAQLRLPRIYLHGDSLSSVDVRVLEISSEAELGGARADTSFDAGPQVTTASISPTDSVVTIDLPNQWVADNASVLRDTTDGGEAFQEAFHGFKLVNAGGNAVVGFSSTETVLRLSLTSDTTTSQDYPAYKTFTHVERANVPPPPDNRVLLQDGVGVSLSMEWNADSLAKLENSPLNRAEIYVPIDTSALRANSGSDSFVRPLPNGYRITATRAPGSDTPPCGAVATAEIPNNDTECVVPVSPQAAPAAAVVPNTTAFPIYETTLLRGPVFTTYRVAVGNRQSTDINPRNTVRPALPSTLPALVPTSDAATDRGTPTLTLTVTPL